MVYTLFRSHELELLLLLGISGLLDFVRMLVYYFLKTDNQIEIDNRSHSHKKKPSSVIKYIVFYSLSLMYSIYKFYLENSFLNVQKKYKTKHTFSISHKRK